MKTIVAWTDDRATFDQAFAACREADVDQFVWHEKRYTTKLVEEVHNPKIAVITRIFEEHEYSPNEDG